MGILSKLRKGNNKELTLNDLKKLDGMKLELESQLIDQKKQRERELYKIKCDKCGTEIKLSKNKVQRVYCDNQDCLSKYLVKVSFKSDDKVKTGALMSRDWIKGSVDHSLDLKVAKPVFDVEHIGYAWEDRLNFPASEVSSSSLFQRIDKERHINKDLEAVVDDLIELVRRKYYKR